ncbi:MAG: ankyrin repeat domain-containing protein [Abditibacteriota bacterium]|nr:ankyrin repeat domain-containing protein [Abditibacteriota bacterium]
MTRKLIAIIAALLLCAGLASAAPIHDAAAKGDDAKIRSILAKDPKAVNAKDAAGATPLHHAAAGDKLITAKFLISKGANVNGAKKDGVTPLHVAANLGAYDVAEALVAAGAKADTKDKKGRTPVSLAQAKNDARMVEILSAKPAPKSAPKEEAKPAPKEQQAKDNAGDAKRIEIAKQLIDCLAKNDYGKAQDLFDGKMNKTFTPDQMKLLWEQALISQTGPFKGASEYKNAVAGGAPAVNLKAEFQNYSVYLQLLFDSENLISGLNIIGDDAPAE